MWQRSQLLPPLEKRKQRKTKQNKRSPIPARRRCRQRRPQRRCLCSVLYVCMYVWYECLGSKLERPSAPLPAPQSESCAYLMRVSVKRATATETERVRERAH